MESGTVHLEYCGKPFRLGLIAWAMSLSVKSVADPYNTLADCVNFGLIPHAVIHPRKTTLLQ